MICLPYHSFFSPIPPTPFPAGRGGLLVYFAGGYRPRHPGIKPPAALTASAMRTPRAGAGGGTCTTNEFCLSMGSSAGSQGEGGPGERNFGV